MKKGGLKRWHKENVVYIVKKQDVIVYIGITTQGLEKRKAEHLRHSKYKNNIFSRALQKHGSSSFVFEEYMYCFDKKSLSDLEIELIRSYRPRYNLSYNSSTLSVHKWTRSKLSATVKVSWKNKEYRLKKLEGMRSEQNRLRASEVQKRRLVTNCNYYKKLTQTAKNWDYENKQIIDTNGRTYKNVLEFAKLNNTLPGNVGRVLLGKRKTICRVGLSYLDGEVYGS